MEYASLWLFWDKRVAEQRGGVLGSMLSGVDSIGVANLVVGAFGRMAHLCLPYSLISIPIIIKIKYYNPTTMVMTS